MKKRPITLTIISLLLGWLALAGFANAAIGLMGYRILPLIYGLTALTTAIALWKMKPWGFTAFIAWSVIAILTAGIMQKGQFKIPLYQFAGFVTFVILILMYGGVLIYKGLKRSVGQPPASQMGN
ncbi:MAG: hypothetical protein WC334_00285 [Kiritimatiellales bacterium]|jgi:hypothetical protein